MSNFLVNLFEESKQYSDMDLIEKYIEEGKDLTNLPVQPMYSCVKQMPTDAVAEYLPRFSPEQRQTMLDVDLWFKDVVNPNQFNFWIEAYVNCKDDDVRLEFVKSESFLLWLKSRVNIWTFDVEDPMYPDHDNYFLTDDGLLLIEFDENFEYVNELKMLIRTLYGAVGVERAYDFLFKVVADGYSDFLEHEYHQKKDRLADYGFVDYFDALELTAPLQKLALVDAFIKKHVAATGHLDSISASQCLNHQAIKPFMKGADNFFNELDKIKNEDRKKFVNFDFIRTVNAAIALDNALQAGPVALAKVGKNAEALMRLGFSYAQNKVGELFEGLFSEFLFSDFYKIGNSLAFILRNTLKKSFAKYNFEDENEGFLGSEINDLADYVFMVPTKIENAEVYMNVYQRVNAVADLMPYASEIFKVISNLKVAGQINDQFYLNYTVDEIDLESILISEFAKRVVIPNYEHGNLKLGLTLDEAKKFFNTALSDSEHLRSDDEFLNKVGAFIKNIGLEKVQNIDTYFMNVLEENITGYDFITMSEEDFRHVGGVVILNTLK